jgi:hypothetical protein
VLAYAPGYGGATGYFDGDDATQGIFVNDLSLHGDYTWSFAGSRERQDLYRADWAAHRLAYSLVASAFQRALSLPPYAVEDLLRVFALLFAAAGSWLAALALTRADPLLPRRLAIFAFASAHPSLLLFARTGASFYLLAYALFWACVYVGVRYAETSRPRLLYGLAGLGVPVALLPYPPLLCLPAVLALALATRGRLGEALRTRHLYVALALSVALAIVAGTWLGLVYEGSVEGFGERLLAFARARSAAISGSQLLDVSLLDKLAKAFHQQVWLSVDGYGDRTRTDSVWTAGATSPALLVWVGIAVYGAVTSLRTRDPDARLTAAVAGVFALVFLSVSFPEGRYILALVPCWGWFAVRGVETLAGGGAPARALLGVMMAAHAISTWAALDAGWTPKMQKLWAPYEAIQVSAPALEVLEGGRLAVRFPESGDYGTGLYVRMTTRDRVRAVEAPVFDSLLRRRSLGERLVAVEYADQKDAVAHFEDQGLVEVARATARGSGRTVLVMSRRTRVPDSAPPARDDPRRFERGYSSR